MAPQLASASLFGIRQPAVSYGDDEARGRRTSVGTSEIVSASIAASLVFFVAYPTAAAERDQGAQLVATCSSCHRLDGRDVGIPPVVGLDEESLARALRAYKSGERQNPIMDAVAGLLSDEEIAIVARYLAAQGKEAKQP